MSKVNYVLLFLLIVSAQLDASEVDFGGQAIFCQNESNSSASLIAFNGIKKWKFEPSNLGNTYEEAVKNLSERLEKLSPFLAQYFDGVEYFDMRAIRLRGAELINRKDWDDEIVPANCKVEKIILRRQTPRAEDREYLINEDLWARLSPSSQAVLVLEQLLAPSDESLDVNRDIIAYLASDKGASASLLDYLNFTYSIKLPWMDFHGVKIFPHDFSDNSQPRILEPVGGSAGFILHGLRHFVTGKLEYDEKLNIRLIEIPWREDFKLPNQQIVSLGLYAKNSKVLLNEAGFPVEGILSHDDSFTTINDQAVTCLARSLIRFNNEGKVYYCDLARNSPFNNMTVFTSAGMKQCTSNKTCEGPIDSFYDSLTNKGSFKLINFPIPDTSYVLNLEGFEIGQYGQDTLQDTSNYGDYVLNVKSIAGKPVDWPLGKKINVFRDGSLARAEVVKKTVINIKDNEVEIAASGSCGLLSKKKFISIIKNYPHGEGGIYEAVTDKEVILEMKDSDSRRVHRETIAPKSLIHFDRFGFVLNYKSLCPKG